MELASRGIKISPLAKGNYREKFINKCLLRVKTDRESHFAKLRGHFNEDCGSYAREIVSEAIHMDMTPQDNYLGRNNDGTSRPINKTQRGYSIDDDALDVDFYVDVMEQVAVELETEYAECMDELNAEAYIIADEVFESDETEEELLLCPFCRCVYIYIIHSVCPQTANSNAFFILTQLLQNGHQRDSLFMSLLR